MTALDDEIRTLQARVAELEAREADHERSGKIQAALYEIAETASAAQDIGATPSRGSEVEQHHS